MDYSVSNTQELAGALSESIHSDIRELEARKDDINTQLAALRKQAETLEAVLTFRGDKVVLHSHTILNGHSGLGCVLKAIIALKRPTCQEIVDHLGVSTREVGIYLAQLGQVGIVVRDGTRYSYVPEYYQPDESMAQAVRQIVADNPGISGAEFERLFDKLDFDPQSTAYKLLSNQQKSGFVESDDGRGQDRHWWITDAGREVLMIRNGERFC